MLVIPEIQTVVILVPRTGSGSLMHAVRDRYPLATLLFRHMEADGVPRCYRSFKRVGVVRNPIGRLWSVYKFSKMIAESEKYSKNYRAAMRTSTAVNFSKYVTDNVIRFISERYSTKTSKRDALHKVQLPLPENYKSQFLYLRPDLGTEIFKYTEMDRLYKHLGLELCEKRNASDDAPPPKLSRAAERHVTVYFNWDLKASKP